MKANEAPEKLYLSKNIYNTYQYQVPDPDDASNVEYIRTNYFIEQALKFLDGCIPDYIDLKHANVDTFMDVDNERFINDFINYIKGNKV